MYDAYTLQVIVASRLAEDSRRAAEDRAFRAARSRDGLRARTMSALRRRAA